MMNTVCLSRDLRHIIFGRNHPKELAHSTRPTIQSAHHEASPKPCSRQNAQRRSYLPAAAAAERAPTSITPSAADIASFCYPEGGVQMGRCKGFRHYGWVM